MGDGSGLFCRAQQKIHGCMRMDMCFAGKEKPGGVPVSKIGFQLHDPAFIDPLMPLGHAFKPVELLAVARLRNDE